MIAEISLNGLLDAVFELCFRQPAQLAVDLGRTNNVTHIVTLTVTNIDNQQ